MSGSVTSGVGDGSAVGVAGNVTAGGGGAVGGGDGAESVWIGAAHADSAAANATSASFISRPTLAPARSCAGSAASTLCAGQRRLARGLFGDLGLAGRA